MKNKDLRRFFENNPLADETRQFVRYDDEGKLRFRDFKDAELQIVNKNGQSVLEVRGQTLSEIDESIRSANLIDPKFAAENNTYYRHIGPTGQIFDISVSLMNVHAYEGNLMKAPSVGSVSLRFIPDEGYVLPNSITVTNASYTWVEGVVVLTNAIGNVSITIVGEQKEEPSENKFYTGQVISKFIVNPNALTIEEMNNALIMSNSEEFSQMLVNIYYRDLSFADAVYIGRMPLSESVEKGKIAMVIAANTKQLIWLPIPFDPGTGELQPGWYVIDEETEEVTALTEQTTFDLSYIVSIGEMENAFNALNGTIISPVDAELQSLDENLNIDRIVVNPNAKSNEEILQTILNVINSRGTDFIDEALISDSNDDPIMTVQGSTSFGFFIDTTPKSMSNISIMWVSKAMEIDGLVFDKAGFYYVNNDNKSTDPMSITSILELDEVTLLGQFNSDFESFNGSIFKTLESTPSLTQFEVGQTLKGIAVNTNGLSNTEIDNWLDNFDFTQADTINLIEPLGDSNGILVGGGSVAPYPTLIVMGQIPVYYAREQYVSDGLTIPKGWSYMDSDQQVAVPFSGQREVNFAEGAELTITSVNANLSALNGVVLGAIEGEPTPSGLTPFEVGDVITEGITEIGLPIGDDISSILAGLTYAEAGQYPECALVESDGNKIVFAMNMNNVYLLVVSTNTGAGGLVYASEAVEGMIENAGWQVNGNVIANVSATVTSINTTDSGWNGVIVGKAN